MTTRLVMQLADNTDDLSDAAYDSLENETRAALIALYAPECPLVFVPAAAAENRPGEERWLYLGTHICGDRRADDNDEACVELLAWIVEWEDDDTGEDDIDWSFREAPSGGESRTPIRYCPFCGINLKKQLSFDEQK